MPSLELALVGQRLLHRRPVLFEDRLGQQVSVFPLFDDHGRTRALMLTDEDDGEILLVDFERGTARGSLLPGVWPHHLRIRRADARDGGRERAERFADLWHFDPWWKLREPRYSGHAARETLVDTNLPAFAPDLSEVWFDRFLSRVVRVASGHGEQRKVRAFEPTLLRRAEARREATRAERLSARGTGMAGGRQPAWRLRPFWI